MYKTMFWYDSEGGCALQQYINEFTSGPFLDYIRADAFARLKAACEGKTSFFFLFRTLIVRSCVH